MKNIYSQEITLSCYDVDEQCRLKPASFLNMAQEAAQRHAAILGFGYDDLIRNRTAWVLSRIHVRFLRYPLWREKVALSTWHKGAEGPFYLRDFEMRDSVGEVLIAAASSWLVMDIDTRRLSRETGVTDNGTSFDRDALEFSCAKIRIPAGVPAEDAGQRRAAYSDVDMNGHVNNACYPVWAMDSLDCGFIGEHPVRELALNFNSETHPGEIVHLYRYDFEDKMYFEGKNGGRSAFTMVIEYGGGACGPAV